MNDYLTGMAIQTAIQGGNSYSSASNQLTPSALDYNHMQMALDVMRSEQSKLRIEVHSLSEGFKLGQRVLDVIATLHPEVVAEAKRGVAAMAQLERDMAPATVAADPHYIKAGGLNAGHHHVHAGGPVAFNNAINSRVR